MDASRVSRFCAWAALAAAGLVGLGLFALGVKAQILRLAFYAAHGLGFADPYCSSGYCDYGIFWLAGVLARHGQAALAYDPARFALLSARLLPNHTGWLPFVYPPPMLLPAWAMAWLPLAAGYYLVSVLLALLSVRLLRAAGLPWICVAAGLFSFPAMWTIYLGQFGLICGALLVYGLAAVETRPGRAGAAMGLLAIKPQYALLVPVVVLAARRGQAIMAGLVVLGLMLAASWIIGGAACWHAYLGPGRAAMKALLEQPFPGDYETMGSSVFWMLRSLHVTVSVSYLGQALVSGGCAVLSWRLWRAKANNRLAATVFLSLLASPYGFTGYMAMYCAVLPLLGRPSAHWRNAALAWLWVAPAFVPVFVRHFGVLPTPLLLTGALLLAWQNKCCPVEKTPAPATQLAEQPQCPAAEPEPA